MNETMHFLVVDDFSTMRRIVGNLLKELGHIKITEADDGVRALAILNANTDVHPINFVVCHEKRAKARETVLKMEVGLPKSACRRRLQTAQCCCAQKAWW